jgi:hypothetical protein
LHLQNRSDVPSQTAEAIGRYDPPAHPSPLSSSASGKIIEFDFAGDSSSSSISQTPDAVSSGAEDQTTNVSTSPDSSLITAGTSRRSAAQRAYRYLADYPKVSYPLTLPPEFEALAFFFRNFVLLPHNSHEAGRGFLELLGPMFSQTKPSSSLHKATEAISMSALGTFPQKRELRDIAKNKYGQAIKGLALAIADPVQSKTDETLMSILLCSLFEVRGRPELGHSSRLLTAIHLL